MKTAILFSKHGNLGVVRRVSKNCLTGVLLVLLGCTGGVSLCLAQPTDHEAQGTQVLTRGPVHEAFAGIVSYDPEPGVVVSKAPPDLIEEVPPEERPEGDNVAWIPGYWAWDDERNDFLWISGTWRALPPGREWIAGYWAQTSAGHQWISGYWADAATTEATYLPAPPATVETGPNIAAPSDDYGWTPGCWLWHQGRYAWRPGYWTPGRADWDWTPAHYVWTPRGYIFVDGFWDYSVERRGVLFAPVYFESGVYARRGYHYSPTIVIDLGVFSDHLFLRPRYQHYYFGDYYATSYQQGGIYASFSFQSSRYGYDPFYSRQRWVHREDRGWENRVAASYQYRRDHEAARPPRTWSAQLNITARSAESPQNRMRVAMPIDQMVQRADGPVRFQPVAREERKQLVQRGQDVQKSRDQRRTLESKPEDAAARKPGTIGEPAKVPMPRSPIVAKPASQLGRNQPPPQAQPVPLPEIKSQPKADSPRRPPNADRTKPQPQARQPDPERRSSPTREEAVLHRENQPGPDQPANIPSPPAPENAPRNLREREQKALQNATRESQAEALKNQEDSHRHTRELENSRQASEQRAKDSALKAQENSQRNTREHEHQARPESERQANPEAQKNAQDARQHTRELESNVQQEAEQRAKVSAIRAQEESRRNARESEQKARKESVRPVRKEPGKDQPEATRPPKKDERKDEERKPSAPEEPPTP